MPARRAIIRQRQCAGSSVHSMSRYAQILICRWRCSTALQKLYSILSVPKGHMTFKQRRINVDGLSCCIDVISTFYKRHECCTNANATLYKRHVIASTLKRRYILGTYLIKWTEQILVCLRAQCATDKINVPFIYMYVRCSMTYLWWRSKTLTIHQSTFKKL